MLLVLVNDNEGILKELVHIGTDRASCEQRFIEACALHISNWSDYTPADIATVLDNGYEQFGGGVVMLIDTSNCVTDGEIRDQLTGQPPIDMKVVKVVEAGELGLVEGMTVDQIIEQCGYNLDGACSWEIQGPILFQGSDGKWYTVVTESSIAEAHPDLVADTIEHNFSDGLMDEKEYLQFKKKD